MEELQLHYSRGKLIRLVLLGLVLTAMMLWLATGGVADGEETRGRGAWLGRTLGPEGLRTLGWIGAVVAALFAGLSLRRAFGDPVAARADRAGLTIHTIFGSHVYAAQDIAALEIRRPAGQAILQVVPGPGGGKQRGLTLNSLAEDEEEIGEWMGRVHALHSGGS